VCVCVCVCVYVYVCVCYLSVLPTWQGFAHHYTTRLQEQLVRFIVSCIVASNVFS